LIVENCWKLLITHVHIEASTGRATAKVTLVICPAWDLIFLGFSEGWKSHAGSKSANTNPSRSITTPACTWIGLEKTGASHTNV
jgi:hypothetical protein